MELNTNLKLSRLLPFDALCLLGFIIVISTAILTQCTVFSFDVATVPSESVIVELENSLYFEIVWPESLTYTYKLRPAKDFGTAFDREYQKVELILADPEDGCQELYNNVQDAVVLILRGGCSFLTKTQTAERAGALAAIITDNDENNDSNMIDMVDDSTSRVVKIPSAFLLGKDGSMIRQRLYMYGTDRAIINIPVNITGKPISATRRPPWTVW